MAQDRAPVDSRDTGGTYFLGRYRVVDEIGIGGMASVHLSRMDGPGGFQKWVAIKKIHAHLVEDESFVQMFLDEARIAARISHPNVATVFDLGKHEDTFWIAMEYLHGEPLREVMRRTEELGTAMPPEIACRVIADAAEGLHAAHELLGKNGEQLGLVHRDVTPHNLFVTYDGVTKVVDFGIAKFASRASHTRAGTLKGKLAYMSPEQVHGEGIDRRTDIFALGVVLWELTTGQRLFRMESDLDTLAKVQECNVPRPSTLIRGYPVDLEKIVMKALSKNRGERFKTSREFSRALQSLLMRRGLFIASDEVASYTQSIFADRIQKRDAHLRWAAEVTQTINVDQLLSKPKIGPEFTGNSDVQSSASAAPAAKAGVRPAAGSPSVSVDALTHSPASRRFDPPTFDTHDTDDHLQTGPSMATASRPNHGRQPRPSPSKAPAAPPRPAAGAPPSMAPPRASGRPQPARVAPPAPRQAEEDDHPADGDGPTIQAAPSMLAPVIEDPSTTGRREPPRSEPPTMMEAPTGVRSVIVPETVEPDLVEEEDGDETIVHAAHTRDQGPLNAPPMFPQAPRANGGAIEPARPAPATANTQPPGPRFQPQQTGPLAQSQSGPTQPPQGMSASGPRSLGPHAGFSAQPGPMHGGHGGHGGHGDAAYENAYGMPMNAQLGAMGPDPQAPMDYGRDPYGQMMQPGMHPSQQPQNVQPFGRVGSPSSYNGTIMTSAQPGRGRPPMWVVAALSCSIALLVAGVVVAVFSATSPSKAPTPATSSGPRSTAATPPSATPPATNATAPTALTPPAADPTPAASAPTAEAPGGATAATAAGTPAGTPTHAASTPTPATPPARVPAPVAPTPAAAAVPGPTPKKPAALGALTIVCMPKCSDILDNGSSLGGGNVFNRPVPSGKHSLVLTAASTGVRKQMVVDVLPDQTREVRLSMEK
jgi:serine/threonine-protein kinase